MILNHTSHNPCQKERQLSKRSFTSLKIVEEVEEVEGEVVVVEVEVEVELEQVGVEEGEVDEEGVEVEERLVDLGIVQKEDLDYLI